MNAKIIENKNDFVSIMQSYRCNLNIGLVKNYDLLVNNFSNIVSNLNGKFILFEKDSSAMLFCLISFNHLYCIKNKNSFAQSIIDLISIDVAKSIQTAENEIYLILSLMVSCDNSDINTFFYDCFDKLKNVYREYDFIICQHEQIGLPSLETEFFFHKISNLYIYHAFSKVDMEDICFSVDDEAPVYLALPENADIDFLFERNSYQETLCSIENFEYYPGNTCVFLRKEFSKCIVKVLKITYDQLLQYQRHFNNFDLKEHCEQLEHEKSGEKETCNFLIYTIGSNVDYTSIWNDRLKEMIKSRQKEWAIIPDVILMYPVCFENINNIENSVFEYNCEMAAYMHFLDVRLQCETGVPFGNNGADMMERFKGRIRRYYIGAVKLRITEEMITDILDKDYVSVGADIYANLMLAIDEISNVGVLYVVSLSSPFLLSYLLDNVVRNQLMVVNNDNSICNLYEYILTNWGLSISGTPKSFITIPKSKEFIDNQQLGSLLMSETIYEDGEDFSKIVDKEIIKIADDKYGLGQYDAAYVGAHSNTLIQFYPSYQGSKKYRLFWNSVTAFYIELILFEEASINRFNRDLVGLMSQANETQPEVFLKLNREITNRYLNSVEFWDVQLNYPSSQQSIKMIREAFKEQNLVNRMARYQEQVKNIFEINKEIVDRNVNNAEKKSTDNLNFILLVLTVVSTVSSLYTIVDIVMNYLVDNPINNIFPIISNIVVMIVVSIIYIIRRKKL